MRILIFIGLFIFGNIHAQDSTFVEKEISINKFVDGTLLLPNQNGADNLAILIGGSGPIDRNGNQNFQKSYTLKKLAEALAQNGIATYRYDKRTAKQVRTGIIDKDTSFDDFVTDAISVIDYFKNSANFEKIYLMGHSQGSLVGMIAARGRADGFISLAGAGQSIDEVITYQVETTANIYLEDTKRIFSILKTGETTTDFPIALASIFNLQVQPFIISWMKYKPTEEIKKLEIPVLILNGTKDLQVTVEEADMLIEAYPKAELKIIENMNHVLFPIEGDDLENAKSYNESYRSISEVLIDSIEEFIGSNN